MTKLQTRSVSLVKEHLLQLLPIVILLSVFTIDFREEVEPVFGLILMIVIVAMILIWEKIAYYKVKRVDVTDDSLEIVLRDNSLITCEWKNLEIASFKYKHWLWMLKFSNETVVIPKTFSNQDIELINQKIVQNVCKNDAKLNLCK